MWVCQGHSLDVTCLPNGLFRAELEGIHRASVPQAVLDRVYVGETITWMRRGFTLTTRPSGPKRDNGNFAACTEQIARPSAGKLDESFWSFLKTGRASKVDVAIELALQAEMVEVR